jgi:hypothetical protein
VALGVAASYAAWVIESVHGVTQRFLVLIRNFSRFLQRQFQTIP